MIAFLSLIVWRFVFAGLHRKPLARAIATLQEQQNQVFEHGPRILERLVWK
jgi:hypothetical protein